MAACRSSRSRRAATARSRYPSISAVTVNVDMRTPRLRRGRARRLLFSCWCGWCEERRQVHINAYVLHQVAALAQDRGGRNAHLRPVLARVHDMGFANACHVAVPRLDDVVAQPANRSPELGQTVAYGFLAGGRRSVGESKAHIVGVLGQVALH